MGTLEQPTSFFSGGFTITGQIDFNGGFTVGNDIVDANSGDIVWDESSNHVPISSLEENSIGISTNDGLSGGTTITLGGSTGISVVPSDFAGSFITEDGSGDLQVDITNGLEGDGSGNIRVNGGDVAGNVLSEGGNVYEVDLNIGNGVTSSGSDLIVDADNYITVGSSGVSVNISDGLESDGSDNIRVQGDAISDGFLSEGTNDHQVSVNLGSGVEGDGSNNIRASGSDIADSFLSEGTNPYNLSVNLGNGVEGDGSNNIRVNGGNVAGTYLSEGTNSYELDVNITNGLEGDGSDNIRVNGADIAGNVLSEGTNPYEADVNIGNGLSSSGTDLIADSDTFITVGSSGISVNITNGLESDGSDNIRVNGGDIAGNVLSEDATNPYEINLDFGNGLTSTTGTLVAEANSYITVGSSGISVNISDGLEGDGSDNIRVQGDAVAGSFLSEGTNAYQLDVNLGNGVEGDGSDNIRINGGQVAGNVLSEGTNAYEIDVNIGNGLTNSSSDLAVSTTEVLTYDNTVTVTANQTVSYGEVILVDASGGAITLTLPAPQANAGVTVKKIDSTSNTVTVETPNTETIDGSSTMTLSSQYISREITSDGSNYFII